MGSAPDAARRTRLEAGDRREQIVQAAQMLFARRPYDSVSTGEIAAAAGTTRTNILYHFSTKRDLFLEIVGPFARISAELPPTLFTGSIRERVSYLLMRWLDAVERHRETFRTMLNAASSQDPQVSAVLQDSMHAWERRLLVILGMDPVDPAHRAMIQSFQAMVAASTAMWLESNLLTKAQVHSMLTACLVAIGESHR